MIWSETATVMQTPWLLVPLFFILIGCVILGKLQILWKLRGWPVCSCSWCEVSLSDLLIHTVPQWVKTEEPTSTPAGKNEAERASAALSGSRVTGVPAGTFHVKPDSSWQTHSALTEHIWEVHAVMLCYFRAEQWPQITHCGKVYFWARPEDDRQDDIMPPLGTVCLGPATQTNEDSSEESAGFWKTGKNCSERSRAEGLTPKGCWGLEKSLEVPATENAKTVFATNTFYFQGRLWLREWLKC